MNILDKNLYVTAWQLVIFGTQYEHKALDQKTVATISESSKLFHNLVFNKRYLKDYWAPLFFSTIKTIQVFNNITEELLKECNEHTIFFLKGYNDKLKKIALLKTSSVLNLKSFIYNKYLLCSYKGHFFYDIPLDEKQVRVHWFHNGICGTSLSNDKKMSDYNIPTKTILKIDIKGFPIFF